MSHIATAELASAGRTGGFFWTSVAPRNVAGIKIKLDTIERLLRGRTKAVIRLAPDLT
jgi:hypothetical protein